MIMTKSLLNIEYKKNNNPYYKDAAFSGITHALSTLATVTLVAAFFPEFFGFIYNYPVAKEQDGYTVGLSMLILCILCTVGSCMLPDLDNTKSRAESSLGIVGSALSTVFRAVASFIQSTFRTSRDDSSPNPHRGFWHSPLGALTLSLPLYFVGSKAISNDNTNYANIILIATVFILSYLAICSLLHKQLSSKKKGKNGALITLFPYVFAGLTVGLMFIVNGVEIFSYAWPIAASVFFGMMLHTFGDCHTTAGAPIFAPLTLITKKKVWWNTSFLSIESGGEFEMGVLTKVYGLAAIVGTIVLTVNYL